MKYSEYKCKYLKLGSVLFYTVHPYCTMQCCPPSHFWLIRFIVAADGLQTLYYYYRLITCITTIIKELVYR